LFKRKKAQHPNKKKGCLSQRLSAYVDPVDKRWYETDASRREKIKLWNWYDPNTKAEFRKPRTEEEAYWQDIIYRVIERWKELKQEMGDEDFRPAIRTIWYDLVSEHRIDNNENKNKKFDERITEARHLGIIRPDAFSDETRPDLDEPPDQAPEEYAMQQAQWIVYATQNYTKPRWRNQKYHVLVLLEKLAQSDMVKHILADKQVTLMVARGNNSYTRNFELYARLLQIQRATGKKIVLLYLGDWDPSGDVMDETIVDYLNRFGRRYQKLNYQFERVAVLAEHETAFGVTLPSKPDARVYELDSLGRPKDKNAARFKARYGVIKQIELDALTSRQLLPHFRILLRDKVDSFWEENVWEKIKDQFTEQVVKQELDKRVKLTKLTQKELLLEEEYDGRSDG
jgi:hypothetical protein